MGVKKAYDKLDDAKRYMRALYANENDPAVIVASLEQEQLDEVIDAAVSDKVVEAERNFPGNLKPNVRFEPERPLVTAIRKAGSVTAASGPKIVIGKPAVYKEGIGTAVTYTEKDRKKLAKRGEAMPDGSFPIPDKTHLKKAIQSFGRADDPAAVKKWIVKRARALDAVDMLPDSWGITAALGRPFDESKHKRAPKGRREGGRFVSVAVGNLAPGDVVHDEGLPGFTDPAVRTVVSVENDLYPEELEDGTVETNTRVTYDDGATLTANPEQMVDVEVPAPTVNEMAAPVPEAFGYDVSPEDAAAVGRVDDRLMSANNARAKALSELERVNTAFEEKYADGSEPSAQDLAAVQRVNDAYTEADLAMHDASLELRRMQGAVKEKYGATVNEVSDPPVIPTSTPVGAFDNGVEFHQIGDQVYRVPPGAPISTVTGLPMGARWESSVAHWDEFKGVEGTVPFQATRPTLSVNESKIDVERGLRRSSAESAALSTRSRERYALAPQAGELQPGDVFANPVTGEPVEVADVSHQPPIMGRDGNIRVGGSTKITTPDGKTFALPSSDRLQGYKANGIVSAASGLELSGITASAAGMAPDEPPLEWFDDPEFTELTPLTITPEGRVYGHVAPWNACHTGIQGRCVKPPRSSDGVPYFNLAAVRTAEGVEVPVGKITMDTGHASLVASPKATAAHYDNTGTVAADVRAGQDRFGPWVAGAIRPELDSVQVRALERATVSGDWRTINGKHEMVGLLAVNVPGFPIPRAQVSIAASGEEIALVAAGVICGCDDTDESLDEVVFDDAVAV